MNCLDLFLTIKKKAPYVIESRLNDRLCLKMTIKKWWDSNFFNLLQIWFWLFFIVKTYIYYTYSLYNTLFLYPIAAFLIINRLTALLKHFEPSKENSSAWNITLCAYPLGLRSNQMLDYFPILLINGIIFWFYFERSAFGYIFLWVLPAVYIRNKLRKAEKSMVAQA